MEQQRTRPVTVAIINDYDVVVRGVWHLIADDPRLRVVELASMVDPSEPVDVVLYDSFAAEHRVGADLIRLLAHPNVGRLVLFTWAVEPDFVALARRAGIAGCLSKKIDGPTLADALLRVAAGEEVFHSEVLTAPPEEDYVSGDWPGRDHGLTPREAEILGLIVQGHTNENIAQRVYLSINSVKTYIRSAYRKMGVQRRSQAVIWGIQHGFLPRPVALHPDREDQPAR